MHNSEGVLLTQLFNSNLNNFIFFIWSVSQNCQLCCTISYPVVLHILSVLMAPMQQQYIIF